MSKRKIEKSRLYERYKKEKIAFSEIFLGGYLKFILASLFILIPIIMITYGIFSQKMLICILMILGTYTVKKLLINSRYGYFLGILLLWCFDMKNLELALWKFPSYSGLLIATTVHIFCHVHMEIIFNTFHGYLSIIIHLSLWYTGSYYSGIINSQMPNELVFTMGFFVCANFFWYKYKLWKDYQDIERKIHLEENQSNISNLINAVPEGIIVVSEICEIIMKNCTYDKLLQGTSLEELKLIEGFCSNQKGFDENLCKKIVEFFGTDKNSTKFGVLLANMNYLECTGSKVMWDNENAIVLTFREINDLVKLENQITQTSKTLKILRGISHELKTPMNMVINQNSEILNETKGIPDTVIKTVKSNISILQYILSLIRDMIDYSHLKSNNLALSFSWVGITDLIEDCIVILQDMYINSSFEFHLSNQHINVYTDKNRLRQSLLSLISTSLGLSQSPKVIIKIINEPHGLRLTISFDSYKNFLMSPSETINFMRSSLKIKISKKLMNKNYSNELSIIEQDKNVISMTLLFNMVEYNEFKEQSNLEIPDEGDIMLPLTESSFNLRNISNFIDILIVDDIEINIQILKKMIENLQFNCKCDRNHRKYTVHSANSGNVALEMIVAQQNVCSGYKIIIMDCLMPIMDGWETSLEINKMYSQGVIKFLPYIIAYSAFDSKEDLEKCIGSGMCCHVSKPCLKEELCKAINDWITRV
ncbi:hypothetical protein SteCoe_12599 [Stentor coeruleus]|uniref:Response regulatory domain-containing protein n=1 Tax=Stentor coeruleus TaxID=5963 RepID=A0A1R2CAD8_9CILI|nr:hypothetical protein SteCoe_12599 [Stentor coeruleus]